MPRIADAWNECGHFVDVRGSVMGRRVRGQRILRFSARVWSSESESEESAVPDRVR